MDYLLELKNLIIKYGKKEKLSKGFISKMKYINNYYFIYNSLTGVVSLYQDDDLYSKIGKIMGKLSVEVNVKPDVLDFYIQVVRKEFDLNYNFKDLLD